MKRRSIVGLALLLLAACQDYKFNPVGKCVVQTGSARIQLSSISTADILFVVDDSGSMLAEQQRLAANFGSFITTLAQTQAQRKSQGLDPLEFHIAITTSSVFEAYQALAPAGGSPPLCGQPTANTCNIGAPYSSWRSAYDYTCTTPAAGCVDLIDQYWPACSAGPTGQYGQGVQGQKYPAGHFMAAPSVTTPANPRVLHFTKDLAWETWGTSSQDPRITTLVSQFAQNISVGACGSGMEQHFEGGRLAVQKALAGTQPGVTTGEWPHPGAKLVVVWVGDEDDCSNPDDPNKSLAFIPWTTQPTDPNPPGNDVCVHDDALPAAQRKKFPIADYADYFTTLGRSFSAAFIYSADPASCRADASGTVVCTPGTCACQCPTSCTGGCGVDKAGECQMASERMRREEHGDALPRLVGGVPQRRCVDPRRLGLRRRFREDPLRDRRARQAARRAHAPDSAGGDAGDDPADPVR